MRNRTVAADRKGAVNMKRKSIFRAKNTRKKLRSARKRYEDKERNKRKREQEEENPMSQDCFNAVI